ncbi:YcfL family protein [Desulfotalea psychrophila]|uniref:DUF1425 domain-containing protein n=1 Tax=Desulfotalea psychrophila (strain LSv54 / DSM 12343) TaxID=177439 RepID=Q6AQQ7_DESPS|nr:YcfL family protein [Desulfotalea psychrophila]CAG35316.1 unknown protein [Desulfotalea psychrophila LSv54]
MLQRIIFILALILAPQLGSSAIISSSHSTATSSLQLGPKAAKYIEVSEIRGGRLPSGLFRARFIGDSTSSFKKEIKYRFVWLDCSGFELSGITSTWQSIRLSPKDEVRLQSVATSPRASNFQVIIKEL